MATGTNTYEGLAVPLFGESQITQQTAATDILTLTGADTMTGDFLVCENSAGTELFVVNSTGSIVLGKTSQSTFSRLRLAILESAPSSAGLTKGDIWLAKSTDAAYRLAVCISTATGAVRYGKRIVQSTLASTT